MTKNTPFYLFIGYIVISPRCINMFHFLPYIKFGASFANSIKSPLFVVLAKVVSSIVLSFKTKTLSSYGFRIDPEQVTIRLFIGVMIDFNQESSLSITVVIHTRRIGSVCHDY